MWRKGECCRGAEGLCRGDEESVLLWKLRDDAMETRRVCCRGVKGLCLETRRECRRGAEGLCRGNEENTTTQQIEYHQWYKKLLAWKPKKLVQRVKSKSVPVISKMSKVKNSPWHFKDQNYNLQSSMSEA